MSDEELLIKYGEVYFTLSRLESDIDLILDEFIMRVCPDVYIKSKEYEVTSKLCSLLKRVQIAREAMLNNEAEIFGYAPKHAKKEDK